MAPRHRLTTTLLDRVLDGLSPDGSLADRCLAVALLTACWAAVVGAGLGLLPL